MKHPPVETVILPFQLPRTAWANGAGSTREIMISAPSGSKTCSDYRWRLSLADLTQSATFSLLPGIDRVFAFASPGPLTMILGCDFYTLRLGQRMEFKGEAPVAVEVRTDEPQLGLNLMTRRGVCNGSMRIVKLNGQVVLDPTTGVVAATVLQGTILLSDGRILADLATLVLGAKAVALEAEGCLLAIATVREA